MIDRFLDWLDKKVFRCQWIWLCDLVWERQIARDFDEGKLDRVFGGDIGAYLAANDEHGQEPTARS